MRVGFFQTIGTVMGKELRDFSRDHKTIWITLLISPLMILMLVLGMGKLMESRISTQLEKPLYIPMLGQDNAPNLVWFLSSQGIYPSPPVFADQAALEASVSNQEHDVGLVIGDDFGADWRAGKPATVLVVTDSTRRTADVALSRVSNSLQSYSQQVGMLRLLARGVDPTILQSVNAERKDLATAEARRGMLLSILLPVFLMMSAFLGGSHLSMDTTAGERERQSLEPLLATPVARAALVSGKMAAATVVGIVGLLMMLLTFKLAAGIGSNAMARMVDVRVLTIFNLMLVLLPLLLLGTASLTLLAAGAKSMKEAQANLMWLMFLPALPAYGLMAYPIRDTALWQYAVPFLSQNQLIVKISRGEMPTPEQWGVYFGCALALAALIWALAVWRYGQEKLAISS